MHLQIPPQGWHTALLAMPDGALVKSVSNPSTLREAKQTWTAAGRDPARLHTLYRHFDVASAPAGTWADTVDHWRVMFARWVDATFLSSYAPFVDYVSEANEYTASTTWTDPVAKATALQSAQAAAYVWNKYYRGRMSIPADCRLALLSGPVSNDVPIEIFQLAIETDSVIDYHAYSRYTNGMRFAGDFAEDSGRWNTHELAYGLKPRWLFGECGPYNSAGNGWRAPSVLAADVVALAGAFAAWIADLKQTAAYREGRIIGTGAWFTSDSEDSTWRYFQLDAPELLAIAKVWATNWKEQIPMTDDQTATIANVSIDLKAQAARLNTVAGVQYDARALIDLALRDSAGNPASDPTYAPSGTPAGVVKAGTIVPVFHDGLTAGAFANRAAITPDGKNVWAAPNALQKV